MRKHFISACILFSTVAVSGCRSEPPLAKGIRIVGVDNDVAEAGGNAWIERVRANFPPGSSSYDLMSELKKEGFKIEHNNCAFQLGNICYQWQASWLVRRNLCERDIGIAWSEIGNKITMITGFLSIPSCGF